MSGTVRFNDPIHTVNSFRCDNVEFGEEASIAANRFYALYSEYCWRNNYPRQTKSAVFGRVREWSVEFVEDQERTDLSGEPWMVIEGIRVGRGGR